MKSVSTIIGIIIFSIVFSVLSLTALPGFSQSILEKNISVDAKQQRLDHILEIISNQGNFFFSYHSNIIKADSLVTLQRSNQPVKEVLRLLLGPEFEFLESGNYIILRRAPIRIRLVTNATVAEDKYYTISGYVIDDQTGEKISDASVYEKDQLSLANTNGDGFFRLRLKSRYRTAALSVSKEYYEDTTVIIEPRFNQSVTITLMPMAITERTVIVGPDGYQAPASIDLDIPVNDSLFWRFSYIKKDSVLVEKTSLGKWLVSSQQKLQSLNLRKFFVARPYQASVIPGWSTNGKLNSQVVNNFSLNIFGGYTAGTNGVEIGGLFNIDKKQVQYMQVAGLFNIVGGYMNGFQVGGVSNTVLDSVSGFQVGGVNNFVKGKFSGFQVGGVYNHVGEHFNGFQVAGVSNYVRRETRGFQVAGVYNHTGRKFSGMQVAGVTNFTNHQTSGVQIAGVGNISSREVDGAQIAGVFNYTRRLKGVQIGLVNVADTSEGYSIGLINIVLKGYHKLSLYTNEMMLLNAAFKTGNAKLYSIFLGGYHPDPDEKIVAFGYGLGSEFVKGKRLSLSAEISCQQLYRGSWEYYNLLNKAGLLVNYQFGKYFSIYAGPSYSVLVSDQQEHFPGYKAALPAPGYNTQKLGNQVTGWIGWTVGVNFF